MNDMTEYEIIKTGAIPDAMVYWSKTINNDDPWSNCAVTTNTWEIEVDFD
jgi:hypothetical protein